MPADARMFPEQLPASDYSALRDKRFVLATVMVS
jgi:hypothetical protein